MNYLHRSTSPIEKEVGDLIEKEFPSYLTFDLGHLKQLQDGKHWRSDTHPSLEIVGVSCFGLLKSINFIDRNKKRFVRHDPDQRFKSIWMHFGLLFETMSHLMDHLLILHRAAGLEPPTEDKPLSQEELKSAFEKWAKANYEADFKILIESARPITFNPHPKFKDRSLSKFFGGELRKEYLELKRKLHSYRNYYVHKPGVALLRRHGTWLVLRRKNIAMSARWSTMVHHANSPDYKTYFESASSIVEKDLHQTLNLFERIFKSVLIPEYERVAASSVFSEMLHRYSAPARRDLVFQATKTLPS